MKRDGRLKVCGLGRINLKIYAADFQPAKCADMNTQGVAQG